MLFGFSLYLITTNFVENAEIITNFTKQKEMYYLGMHQKHTHFNSRVVRDILEPEGSDPLAQRTVIDRNMNAAWPTNRLYDYAL